MNHDNVCTCRVREVNVVVAVLVTLFAISSWVDINGLFVELPILTQRLPEGWDLPSYMAVTVQVANIAPLAFTIISIFYPHRSFEVPVIYIIIVVGAVACLLLHFFWDATAVVGGELHSVGLLSLQFFLSLVDCTSSVAYLVFMSGFAQTYFTAFYIGEGLSGLLPSLVSLGQGAGKIQCVNQTQFQNVTVDGVTLVQPSVFVVPVYETPKFSIEVFFLFLFAMLIISLACFTLLNFLPYAKKERVGLSKVQNCRTDLSQSLQSSRSYELNTSGRHIVPRLIEASLTGDENQDQESAGDSTSRLLQVTLSTMVKDAIQPGYVEEEVEVVVERKQLGKFEYILLLLLTAWVNALSNGVLVSVQSYSCLPYGIQAYHLSVTLSAMANPLACFVTFFVRAQSLLSVSVVSFLGSGVGAYVMYTAAASPTPPLIHHGSAGVATVVLAWVIVMFFLTFAKVSAAIILKSEGKRALLWCGAFTQVGSLVGALSIFFVVNFYKLLQQADLCR